MAELMIRLAHEACLSTVWCARSMKLLAQPAACHFALVVKGGGLKIHWAQVRVGSNPTDVRKGIE